jgi:hypothetical protein
MAAIGSDSGSRHHSAVLTMRWRRLPDHGFGAFFEDMLRDDSYCSWPLCDAGIDILRYEECSQAM